MKDLGRFGIAAAVLLTIGMTMIMGNCASTPPITDAMGRTLPGSVARLERVELNGRREWISLRGISADKPLLLFLAGGPGGSELTVVRRTLPALEDHFLVVSWDQPGAGKSFRAVPHEDLSLETYLEDTHALVELLCARFGREKVYIWGESWGSALGLLYAQAHPERVKMFFGTGQMVAFLENDLECYALAVDWLRSKGDVKKAEKLERQGPPPYPRGRGTAGKLAAFLMETTAYMREERGIRTGGDTIAEIFSSEYTLGDRVNWVRGLFETLDHFYPTLWEVDLRERIPRLEVPVVFLLGRHDVNASIPLFLDFYDGLEAPFKTAVWFERSGHTPYSSESGRFVEELVRWSRRSDL